MSSKFTTLMYGSLADIENLLDTEPCDEAELRAALSNVISHVRHIEKRVEQLTEEAL